MPKIIDGLEENILKQAKQTLLTQGYKALTIRSVAKACGIAVGTLYNYFSSKEALVARVMLQDWLLALARMREACGSAADIKSGLHGIYRALRDFVLIYRGNWEQYTLRPEEKGQYQSYRKKTVEQLAKIVSALLLRFGVQDDPYLPAFTARMLLTVSTDDDFSFSLLEGILAKLYCEKH